LSPIAKHELIEAIRSALDAVDSAELRVDFSASENSTIARRAHGFGVLWFAHSSDAFFQMSGEEFSESLIVTEIWMLNFFHVDAIEFCEASIEDISERKWKP